MNQEHLKQLVKRMIMNVHIGCQSNGSIALNDDQIQRKWFTPSPPMAPPRDLNKLPGNLMAPIMEQFVRHPNNIAVIDDSSSSQSIGENGAGENRINESAHRLSYRDLASATYYIATQVKNFVANKPLPF